MVFSGVAQTVQDVDYIRYVSADEAHSLMVFQLERLLALLETLNQEDWHRPTACTLWDVREIVAHQAGGYTSGTGYREMIRQYAAIPKKGQLPEDAINDHQVSERKNRTPEELISELRQAGPVAIAKWSFHFRLAKLITIPHPISGLLSVRHLMWVIHSRDTWMHRLDICRATGRKFEQTPGQDDRIVALIIQDVGKKLRKLLGGRAIVIDLSGESGGVWKIGKGEPAAEVQMDALDFCIFASGRYSYEEACSRAFISGDLELAHQALRGLLILF